MRNLIILLFPLVTLIACNFNEPEPKPHPLHAEFELVSLVSEVPVDLSLDGHYDVDLMQEYERRNTGRKFPLSLFHNGSHEIGGLEKFLVISTLPYVQQMSTGHGQNVNYLWLTLGPVFFDAFYHARSSSFTGFTERPQYEVLHPLVSIKEISAPDHETLYVRYRHESVYDLQEQVWKTVYLDAVYKRVRSYQLL